MSGIVRGRPVNFGHVIGSVKDAINTPSIHAIMSQSDGFVGQVVEMDGRVISEPPPTSDRWVRIVVMPEYGVADRQDRPARVTAQEFCIRTDVCVPHSITGFRPTSFLYNIQNAVFEAIEGTSIAMPTLNMVAPIRRIRFNDVAIDYEEHSKRIFSMKWVYTTIITKR